MEEATGSEQDLSTVRKKPLSCYAIGIWGSSAEMATVTYPKAPSGCIPQIKVRLSRQNVVNHDVYLYPQAPLLTTGDGPIDQRVWSLVQDSVRSDPGTGVQHHVEGPHQEA